MSTSFSAFESSLDVVVSSELASNGDIAVSWDWNPKDGTVFWS